jgi:hypothetical protein
LLFSPRWLFLYPGMAMFVIGLLLLLELLAGPRTVGSVTFDIHTIYYASLAVVLGFQSILFWICAKFYGMREGIVPPNDPWFLGFMRIATLEASLIAAALLLLCGLALGVTAVSLWGYAGFQALSPEQMMRLVIPSGTAILLGFQLAYAAFFLNVLGIRADRLDDLA